jgi:hypothetical protein
MEIDALSDAIEPAMGQPVLILAEPVGEDVGEGTRVGQFHRT